jgi:putative DNA primase/helicase
MSTRPKSRTRRSNAKEIVRIVGEGQDEWGNRYIKFRVAGSKRDIPAFSVKQLVEDPTKLFAALANAGWNGFTAKTRGGLLKRLERRKPRRPTFKAVSRLGWVSGAYARPDNNIGNPRMRLERAFSNLDRAMLAKYRTRGTLGQWQEKIAAPCTGNSRLMFSMSLAFTGPILRFAKGPKAGGFQIWGAPGTGKTTAAMVAGSIWGCHRGERREKGFTESWHSTAGAIEITALAHNDALLILDETKRAGATERARAEVVTSVVFGLAEGLEKRRLTNTDSARSWRCYFLSTSNDSLKKIGAMGNIEVDEAHLGRMSDIPLPANGHGIYEQLNGFTSGEALSNALQRRSRRYYGTPAVEFSHRLIADENDNRSALKKLIDDERNAYRKVLRQRSKADRLNPLNRSSNRYATVFAAGSLASRYRIVRWTREQILDAVIKCELDHLRQPQVSVMDPADATSALRAKLVQFIQDNRENFVDLAKQRPRYGTEELEDVLGYIAVENGKPRIYLTSDRVRKIIGGGADAKKLKQALATEGVLEKSKEGKFVVQRRIFTGGKGSKNHASIHVMDARICDLS